MGDGCPRGSTWRLHDSPPVRSDCGHEGHLVGDNFYVIGICRGWHYHLSHQQSAREHPGSWLHLWTWGFDKILKPEQWYLKTQ